jgi:hypothetical protein
MADQTKQRKIGVVMDTKVKALWTAALRSGEYEQTKGYLRTDEGYCCLGVLCEIAVANKVIPAPERVEPADAMPGYGADEPVFVYTDEDSASYLTLPESVMHWAGLDDFNPQVTLTDEYGAMRKVVVSELNDSMSRDFDFIADRIDADL